MAQEDEDDQIRREQARWELETLRPALDRLPERKPVCKNTSGIEVQRLYARRSA